MNRTVQNLLLVACGGVLIRVAVDGSYADYVKTSSLPWIVSAAVALVLIGLVLLWADNEPKLAARVLREPELARRRAEPSCSGGSGHDHGRVGSVVPWLLVLPLLALFLVQPRELGAYTAERNRAAQVEAPAAAGRFPPLAAGDPVDITLLELNQRALYGDPEVLRGRTLVVSGFVTQEKGAKPGDFYVNRLLIACCAADAIPVRAHVTGAQKTYETETWVEITARYAGTEKQRDPNLDPLPTLQVETIERIPVPDQPYAT